MIEGEQLDGKKRIRNDRLVAVAEANHSYNDVKRLKDLPALCQRAAGLLRQLSQARGQDLQAAGLQGAAAARTLIEQAQKAA